MGSYEGAFNSSVLELVAPQESVGFPSGYGEKEAAEWLARLHEEGSDRKVAFFDENLALILTIRFPHDSFEDASQANAAAKPDPPLQLLSFLAHLQVSYEASYISPTAPAALSATAPEIARPPVPPRTTSMGKNKPALLQAKQHPSIFPPNTPLPIPAAAKSDRKYVQAQGMLLASGVWGEDLLGNNPSANSQDAFALLWAPETQEWVAVYRLSVLVSFMATKIPDPLLCLTVSATLREKPLAMTPSRHALAALIDTVGGLPNVLGQVMSPSKANGPDTEGNTEDDGDDVHLYGLEEINLLENLNLDPTFASSNLSLPSTRLGPNTRVSAFSLPPKSLPPIVDTTSPSTPTASRPLTHATLRKSFRKTMATASGFRVRMRTVFVPYFLLPKTSKPPRDGGGVEDDVDSDPDALQARDQREAGNEEHTVVLSVEIENAYTDELRGSSASPPYNFAVEDVVVKIGGSGARTVLVPWGTEDPADIFPIHIAPSEQVNLLYAVSFLRGPEVDEFSLAGTSAKSDPVAAAMSEKELQRSVTINIHGRPFERVKGHPEEETESQEQEVLSYPTRVYPSRWNCVLDLASRPPPMPPGTETPHHSVLPTPASPFPSMPTPTPGQPGLSINRSNVLQVGSAGSSRSSTPAVAGNKRFASAFDTPQTALDARAQSYARMPRSPINYQGATAMLNPANQPQTSPQQQQTQGTPTLTNPFDRRTSYLPPSITFESTYARSPTTYNAPQSPPAPVPPSFSSLAAPPEDAEPRTPAYPAYPGSPPPPPPTPYWQAPLAQQTGAGAVGPSVEIRRERGGVPPTPGPRVGGFGMGAEGPGAGAGAGAAGEPIVVSVGLLPMPARGDAGGRGEPGGIYPLDQFTLDIFVFNQSSWTRRFEVSCPEERRRRRRRRGEGNVGPPGILPLESRVRVGPLLPSTCQSVRMDFLALAPGVHSVDTLTLTDVRTGFTMHLKSVMDVVVLEPPPEAASK
ncbi:hypothetical protein SCP_0301270 [Sparassis crispa]|uniref:Trafficking protein particle complex II-specific subunit 65 IgD3 domain-containing protein n=1 Tax=Sparassis crispa TaxID=139825 RepID=A0A401GE01_9APHY|nr:hypothetical protein SCP_0301270 [Sparassis crispa]GBE80412.1 hypothetical protein SCP_0301270 [Sparassis crispa]